MRQSVHKTQLESKIKNWTSCSFKEMNRTTKTKFNLNIDYVPSLETPQELCKSKVSPTDSFSNTTCNQRLQRRK